MTTAVEQIKERLGILDVVSSYVEVTKAGKQYKGRSPFTEDKTPSFFVSPDRGMYYCFSTGKGGDIFTFIEEMEGVDFKGALKILAEKANVELVKEDPKKRTERDNAYALIEEASVFFQETMKNVSSSKKYVTERGVVDKSIDLWRVGHAPDAWRSLKEHLENKGFLEAAILKAGLIKETDAGKESYDVFRNRIMFPIADSSGRIVAFSGRTLSKEDGVPKYVNSPETELFQKSEILFGYDKAKQGIRKFDCSVIVEGQFDLVLVHQAGYTNAVAISGTALTSHHIMLLERLSHKVILALDSDKAGVASVKRAADLMLSRGMDVKVAEIPKGKDPADVIAENPQEFKKIVGEAVHVIEFLLHVLEKETKDERAFKLRAREEVLPYVLKISNRIDREHFEGYIAEVLGTTKEAIHYEVERLSSEDSDKGVEAEDLNNSSRQQNKVSHSRKLSLTHSLYGIELMYKDDEQHKTIAIHLAKVLQVILNKESYQALDLLSGIKKNELIFSTENIYESYDIDKLTAEINSQLHDLQTIVLKEKLSYITKKMREAEQEGDGVKVIDLQKESKLISDALQNISKDIFLKVSEN